MNIIFGIDQAVKFKEKYTVLELDTIVFSSSNTELTAYCVIENIPLMRMTDLGPMTNLHENLIKEYRKRNWNYCHQAIEHLAGFWGSDMATFYDALSNRIKELELQDLDDTWQWKIIKTTDVDSL